MHRAGTGADETSERSADAGERRLRFEGGAGGVRDGEDGLGLLEPLVHLELEASVLAGEPTALEHPTDYGSQARQLDGLEDVADGAVLDSLHGGLGGGLAGHDENVGIAALTKGRAHDADARRVGRARVAGHRE